MQVTHMQLNSNLLNNLISPLYGDLVDLHAAFVTKLSQTYRGSYPSTNTKRMHGLESSRYSFYLLFDTDVE